MLQMFRHMLGTLPEWLCFSDVLVLTPGRLTDEKGNVWAEFTDEEVENTLRGMYEANDDYQWCGNLESVGYSVLVMARTVN